MNLQRMRPLRLLALLLPLLVVAACGQSAPAAPPPPAAATAAPAAAATTAPTDAPAAATTTAPTTAAEVAPATLRLAYFPNLTHAPALVGTAKGTFQEALGPNVTLDLKTFNAGPALIEALFAGEIDIGYIGPNPAINGYVKSNGEALRIIAGATSGGAAFVVRPEANIKGPADLAGKKLATPQLGNTQDVALRYVVKEAGLKTADEGGDVTILPTQNPDILTLFQKGEIDGAWVPEPWATRLVQEAGGAILIDERELWPDGQFVTTHVIVSKQFLDERPDLVEAFLRGHVAAVEYVNTNPEEALTLVNQEIERITTKPLPQAVLEQASKTLAFTYDPLASSLFTSADHAFELGFLGDSKPDLSAIYALDPLNKVLAEQGLEPIVLP
ncbi:MAG: ABC transporter substrate-binding protein [Chloroflexales bacterium]|nr:ABC transporter substrate-binding protein [Chloroflexales bacterium]